MINNKRIIKVLIPSIAILLTCATLIGNNEAYATSVPYSIIYDDNVTSNMPTDVDTTSMSEQVTMANNTPTRPGFKYLGWCNVIPTNSDGTDLCTGGTSYQPSAALNLDQTGTNNFHFYAMWQEEKTIANSTTMQEVTSCPETIPLETVYTLTDPRDNQTYKVARLKDGKCWMVENLNLAGGTALSADNTDVTSEYIASYTAGDSRLAKSGNTLVLPASDNTAGYNNNTNNYSYVYNSGNKTNCGASGQNTPCYSYYSWDAATLGSGRTIATENTDAPQSICPKGWRLPTSGNSSNNEWKRGDFYALATAYGTNLESNYYESSATFYNNAGPGTVPNFLLAGVYNSRFFTNGGSNGFYWGSTSSSSTSSARSLSFDSGVSSASVYPRGYEFSVRCLFSGQ